MASTGTRASTGWTRKFSRASVCRAAATADTLTRSDWRDSARQAFSLRGGGDRLGASSGKRVDHKLTATPAVPTSQGDHMTTPFRLKTLTAAVGVGAMLMLSSAHAQIKIAMVIPTTGALTQYGDMVKEGATTAVEMANAAGGINGKKIELVVDDACDPSKARWPPTAWSTPKLATSSAPSARALPLLRRRSTTTKAWSWSPPRPPRPA
jgi:hypothetical protein